MEYMISIKINKKKVSIPTYRELTVKQYKEVALSFHSGQLDTVRYISIVTGVNYDKALNYKIDGLYAINRLLGDWYDLLGDLPEVKEINYIEKLPVHKIFKFERYIYDLRKKEVLTAGYRVAIERRIQQKATWLELYLFTLALVINTEKNKGTEDEYNIDEILEIETKLYDYNAVDVLSLGGFFLKSIIGGEKIVNRLLKRFLYALLTKTRRLKSKPELIA